MVHMLSVSWHVSLYWADQKILSRSKNFVNLRFQLFTNWESRCLDVPSLLSWLSARQYAPEGGFSGRTNKLVDACYSHWVGGCWPLVRASLYGVHRTSQPSKPPTDTLYSREGLARYILACCQSKRGGLRDKPGKYAVSFFLRTLHTLDYSCLTSRAYRHPDSYHTCYALVGLSNLQYYHYHTDLDGDTKLGGAFASSFSWESIPMVSIFENKGGHFLDGIDGLTPFHPIYSIPHQAAKDIRLWSQAQASW